MIKKHAIIANVSELENLQAEFKKAKIFDSISVLDRSKILDFIQKNSEAKILIFMDYEGDPTAIEFADKINEMNKEVQKRIFIQTLKPTVNLTEMWTAKKYPCIRNYLITPLTNVTIKLILYSFTIN